MLKPSLFTYIVISLLLGTIAQPVVKQELGVPSGITDVNRQTTSALLPPSLEELQTVNSALKIIKYTIAKHGGPSQHLQHHLPSDVSHQDFHATRFSDMCMCKCVCARARELMPTACSAMMITHG